MKRIRSTNQRIQDDDDDLEELKSEVQTTLLIIESAVTSGLISGITPKAFLATLTYHFLIFAADSRTESDATCEKWTTDLSAAWEPVLDAIMYFIADFDEGLDDAGEFDELRFLRETYGVRRVELSELEERRDCNRAGQILYWVNEFSLLDVPSMIVEIALLAVWYKVAALEGIVDDETYVIVRQYIPVVFGAYNHVLDRAAMSLV